MEQDNAELARKLRVLADRVDAHPEPLPIPIFVFYVYTKPEAAAIIRAIGGKWRKELDNPNSEYGYLRFVSVDTGVQVSIPQSVLGRKVVRWESSGEAILSPEEEAQLIVTDPPTEG